MHRHAADAFETLATDHNRSTLSNTIISAMLCKRLVLLTCSVGGQGRTINVASGSGIVGQPFVNIYGASKAGLIRFSDNFVMEVSDRGAGVFAITPGAVLTQALEGLSPLVATGSLPGWLSKACSPPNENIADPSTLITPERVGELSLLLAQGKADRLSDCLFSAYHHEVEIVANVERVREDILYTLRLDTLDGKEHATMPA